MSTYDNYCAIRDSRQFTDYRVSKLSGIGASTFSDWKNGRSEPKLRKLERIARALGVELYDLLKEQGDT